MFDTPDPIFDADGNMINEPNPIFPVLFQEIERGEDGYAEGHRYTVEQLDADVSYFVAFDRARDFILREGLDVLGCDDMDELRRQGATY